MSRNNRAALVGVGCAVVGWVIGWMIYEAMSFRLGTSVIGLVTGHLGYRWLTRHDSDEGF